jgi:hypothetical protein
MHCFITVPFILISSLSSIEPLVTPLDGNEFAVNPLKPKDCNSLKVLCAIAALFVKELQKIVSIDYS